MAVRWIKGAPATNSDKARIYCRCKRAGFQFTSSLILGSSLGLAWTTKPIVIIIIINQPRLFYKNNDTKNRKKNTKRDKIKDGEKTNQENKPKFRAECKKYESDKTKVRFGNGAERIVKMAEQKTHFVYDLHPHIHGFKENCRFLCVWA